MIGSTNYKQELINFWWLSSPGYGVQITFLLSSLLQNRRFISLCKTIRPCEKLYRREFYACGSRRFHVAATLGTIKGVTSVSSPMKIFPCEKLSPEKFMLVAAASAVKWSP